MFRKSKTVDEKRQTERNETREGPNKELSDRGNYVGPQNGSLLHNYEITVAQKCKNA